MIHFYLKSALRNTQKNKAISFAKLFGVSVSFAVILFSMAYVYYETSFDKCVPDYDKKYRCLMQGKIDGRELDMAVTSPRMAQALVDEIPEITQAVRVLTRGEASFKYQEKNLQGGPLLYAGHDFFTFFGIDIQSPLHVPLEALNNTVISKSLAVKYFGSVEEAINKRITVRGDECLITGVFEDFPNNFHLQAGIIQPIGKTYPDEIGWSSQSYYTYIKTDEPITNIDKLNFKITKIVYSHENIGIDGENATNWEDLKFFDHTYIFYNAEPLQNIHFSNHRFDPAVTSNKTYVYGAIILSILVLIISSVNYINLTAANFNTRLKEIGIRKTTGAQNKQIIWQFLYESLIFWLFGFVIAVLLYEFGGSLLSQYLGFDIDITPDKLYLIFGISLIVLVLFNFFIIVFSMVHISRKKVLNLMKGEQPGRKYFSLRGSLVVVQFGLSALIMLASILANKQISFMLQKDKGYDAENIIMLSMWDLEQSKRTAFIKEIKSYPTVKDVASGDIVFGEDPSMIPAYFEIQKDETFFHTSHFMVDEAFKNVFNFKMFEGRFFNNEKFSNKNAVVLNEAAAREYAGTGSVIGKELLVGEKTYTIIGIVNDFNFRSLYHPVQPLIIRYSENYGIVYIKAKQRRAREVIDIIEEQWEKFNISFPFQYTFHDELLAKQYAKDQQIKKLLLILSIISICIACVGLYAISLFITIRKTKEIGIRKVNGAKSLQILGFLNVKLLKWIGIAFLVASPIAWYAMNQWLQNFAYRTELSWWIFVLAAVLALGVAFLTVSWQSWKAARRNPVDSLRYE